MDTICSVSLFRLHAPLQQPYHTAFGDIPFFDTVVAIVRGKQKQGFGESVALPGYSWESPDDVWATAKKLAPELPGKTSSDACAFLRQHVHANPFGVTPLISSVEVLSGVLPDLEHEKRFPLVGILNVAEIDAVPHALETLLASGFTTIKFKIGFDVAQDIAKTKLIQKLLRGKALLRIDANQLFSLDGAKTFALHVPPDGIELLEQPFPVDDWESVRAFAAYCPYPLMLDESIYSLNEIHRAADLGCVSYIKLKIAKTGGLRSLREQIRTIREKGMKVVVGNGVATDIACYLELRAALEEGVETAGEMNGYLKLQQPLAASGVHFSMGHAVLEKGCLIPDGKILQEQAVDSATFSQ